MVQSILSSMSSDEVNSISDTTESLQVAEILKQTYFNILSRSKLPIQQEMFQLNASTDSTQPVLMYRPDQVAKMDWIKYFDGSSSSSPPEYKYVTILPVTQFLDIVNGFNTDETDVESFTFTANSESFTFNYKNAKQPQFCTAIENYYIIFDSFDASIETTLQASKTQCWGEVLPTWFNVDGFIPDFDDQQFPLLLNEAKALAFYELKQQPHAKAEQEARRQWGTLQKDKSLTNKPSYFDQLPNFGRNGSYQNNISYFKSRGWD